MLQDLGKGASTLFTGIIGLAILAVVLSNGSATVQVLQTAFSGLTSLITSIVTPVQGGSDILSTEAAATSSNANGVPNLSSALEGGNSLLSSALNGAINVNNTSDEGIFNNVTSILGATGF